MNKDKTPIREYITDFVDDVKLYGSIWYAVHEFLKSFNWFRRINDKYWNIRHKYFDKYHIVKTNLEPGYYDIDTRLMHSMFSLLCEYVENEQPDKYIDWDSSDEYRHVWNEIRCLYNWWKYEFPNRKDPIDTVACPKLITIPTNNSNIFEWCTSPFDSLEIPCQIACSESRKLTEKWRQEDELMMIRLIKIREYLWT